MSKLNRTVALRNILGQYPQLVNNLSIQDCTTLQLLLDADQSNALPRQIESQAEAAFKRLTLAYQQTAKAR